MSSVLVVRLDSLGDMLVCGPAVRALAAVHDRVTVLAGPGGADAARLLPGVDDVLEWHCPWIAADAPEVEAGEVAALVARLRGGGFDSAVLLTSFHQSALPTALVLRLAGIGSIVAVSEDYPGSLLDIRVPSPPEAPEPQRMLHIAEAAGGRLPAGDAGELRVRVPQVVPPGVPAGPFAAVHPGVSAPARAYPAELWAEVVRQINAAGLGLVVTGSAAEYELVAEVAADVGVARAGYWSLAELAAVLSRAEVVAVANTGPAHLAAAVGTPVVSLFAPVVPAGRWAPYGVPVRLMGDQNAVCAGTRARRCPVEGHPCLATVPPAEVAGAVLDLARSAKEAVPA